MDLFPTCPEFLTVAVAILGVTLEGGRLFAGSMVTTYTEEGVRPPPLHQPAWLAVPFSPLTYQAVRFSKQ